MLTAEYLAGDIIEIKYTGDGMGNSVDSLSPQNCIKLIRSIISALFEYKKITGKSFDEGRPKLKNK